MVPRLLLLALVAVLGGLAGARLGADDDRPSREAAKTVRPATPTVAETGPTVPVASVRGRRRRPRLRASRTPMPAVTTEPASTPAATVPALRRIPNVVGLPEAVAVAQLGRSGLNAVARPQTVSDRSRDGIVLRQFPASGLRVLAGTAVMLVVARYAP